MVVLSEIIDMVKALARSNKTLDLLPSVTEFIESYYLDFPHDYIPCKNSVNGRFKKGKLEELLIYLFAELCNWSNSDKNLHDVHLIMQALGYHSYKIATRRYRQMIENAKKEIKQNMRVRNRIRSIHSKVKNHKSIHCREYSRASRQLKEKGSGKSSSLPPQNISQSFISTPIPAMPDQVNALVSVKSGSESIADSSPQTNTSSDYEDTLPITLPDLYPTNINVFPSQSSEESFQLFSFSDPFVYSLEDDCYPLLV